MPLRYPEARIDTVSDTLAGVSFPDPYRWLENESGEVRRWQRAQAELASSYVAAYPHWDQLHRLVEQFTTERYVTLPRFAAGKWFRTGVAEGASQAHVLVSDEALGDGRVLFDPQTEGGASPEFISWIEPSPDGRTLALGLCADGSENNSIRLIDVATGQLLRDAPLHTLMDSWTGGIQWLPDSSGFFFSAIAGAAIDFDQRVYLHRRSPEPITAPVEVDWSASQDYRMVVVSQDGLHESLRSNVCKIRSPSRSHGSMVMC